MSENLSPARLRVGDLLITSVGTWVIAGEWAGGDPVFSAGIGFIWIAIQGRWVFREFGVARSVMRTDRVIS